MFIKLKNPAWAGFGDTIGEFIVNTRYVRSVSTGSSQKQTEVGLDCGGHHVTLLCDNAVEEFFNTNREATHE